MHLKMEFFRIRMDFEKTGRLMKPRYLKKLEQDKIPEWIQGSKEDIKRVIKDVVDNLDSNNYTANMKNNTYDLENAEKFFLFVFTEDIDENGAKICIKI